MLYKLEFFVSCNDIITSASFFLLCVFWCKFFKKVIVLHHGDNNFLFYFDICNQINTFSNNLKDEEMITCHLMCVINAYDKNVATFMLELCYDKNSRQTLANHRLEACNFIKKETHRCFPRNFAKFIRTPFIIEHLRWLLFRWSFFLIKLQVFFNRIPMVAPSDLSLQ